MTSKALLFISSIALAAGMVATPVGAGGLLGGGGLLSVNTGPAGSDALVNVGLGSGSGDGDTLADVRLGGSGGGSGAARAGASVGLDGGLAQGDDGLLRRNLVDASPLLAGLDLRGLGVNPGSVGGNGNGGAGAGAGTDGRVLVGSLDGAAAVCSLNDGRDVLQRAARAAVNAAAWRSAANVEIVPVKLCPQTRAQVAQVFSASGKINQLRAAVSADALITASLNRTRYDAGNVFAVEASGGKLRVYVF